MTHLRGAKVAMLGGQMDRQMDRWADKVIHDAWLVRQLSTADLLATRLFRGATRFSYSEVSDFF